MGSKSGNPPLIAIVGETASGKTATAIRIAQHIKGEIICADSRTVYKQMNIGTAKPTKEEQRLVPHHMLDVVEPNEDFNVAEFKERAEKCIQDIHIRGSIPIVVGGTGLYVDALLYNFQFSNPPDKAHRAQLLQMTDEELTTLLHTKNISTTRLNTKNRRHVIRAIETEGRASVRSTLRDNVVVAGLKLDRELLRQRISQRMEKMFRDSFLDEVRSLLTAYNENLEAFRTPGYNAALRYLKGEIGEVEARAAFIAADMKLAKRQRTWFKRNPDIVWFEDPELLIQKAVEFARSFNYNKA